ncbi:MAG: rhodanese-like domain-containing protein [Bacilli bacterium]|nr:rhodanese-like domain-containing protein [Bacilli bacterium]MDD4282302.1 rhodanese-like domain-containing protein [Bacilli bacterium]MDD4718765.1 rhodanese-like domain-containing protein [Bacilli bacterium]
MISNISMSDFIKQNHEGQIIDIRSIQSYNNNHIPGARNIPKDLLLANPQKYINKFQIYYIYCQCGARSINVCKKLKSLGYKVVNINGGYESWILER